MIVWCGVASDARWLDARYLVDALLWSGMKTGQVWEKSGVRDQERKPVLIGHFGSRELGDRLEWGQIRKCARGSVLSPRRE